MLFFLFLTAMLARHTGVGYFSNGWGGEYFSLWAFALAMRVLLLWLAHAASVRDTLRPHRQVDTSATAP
jgi:hypothetical protein